MTDVPEYALMETAMNSEHRWTAIVDYFQLVIRPRAKSGNVQDVNQEINQFLSSIEGLHNELAIEWVRHLSEFEISEQAFREWAYYRIRYSIAYNSELMNESKALNYVNQFIAFFPGKKRYFTNYGDLNEIILKHQSISNYQLQKSSGYGSESISQSTFDCALIIVSEENLGAIIMCDED